MCALLCCGPCFDSTYLLTEDGIIYRWLDALLTSRDDKVSFIFRFNQTYISHDSDNVNIIQLKICFFFCLGVQFGKRYRCAVT